MKKLCTCVIAMLCLCGITGCGRSETTDKDKETLIIGIDDTFAPMGFKNDDGEIIGFDVEIAKEVAKKLDKEVVFQNIDWDLKESELADGNIDLIWNGYSVTEERKEKVLFSDPYMQNRQLIITRKDSTIEKKSDLKDKVVSVQKSSSAYKAIMEDSFFQSLTDWKPVQFDTNNDCFMDLEAGRSDAIVVDETLARYYMKQQSNDIYKVLEDNLGTEDYAVGMRKSDTELCDNINKALQELKEDGTFDTIKNKWFEE